jgi:beta-glucosidase
VAGCIKHFVANEQETQRGSVNEIVSRRALEEIYFPPFRAAVEQGNVWTAMAAYNKVNGDWCTASHYLLTDVLRDEWNFHGVLMSDWGAVHDTKLDLNAGTDLEMKGQPRLFYNMKTITPLLASGDVTQATVDEHVRRILRLIVAMGFMDRNQTDSSIPLDDPRSAATAVKVAGEGIVLLKNEGHLLPLDRTAVHHLVVTGPNAEAAVIGGGGSGSVHPFTKVSVLQGIQSAAGAGVQVEDLPDLSLRASAKSVLQTDDGKGATVQGLTADYFPNAKMTGPAAAHRIDPEVDFAWGKDSPAPGIDGAAAFSVRWHGTITAPDTGDYVFKAQNDDRLVVYLDDKQILKVSPSRGTDHQEVLMPLEKNRTYQLRVEYLSNGGYADVHFGWAKLGYTPDEVSRIAAADAVVFAGGLNPAIEHEGVDRAWDMPPVQMAELRQLLAINPRVIVAINAGGNLGLGDNLDHIPALLWAWYPGQNGNTALARIIFGDLNPSGRLPDTFEKRFEDSPAYGNFPGDPANGGSVKLEEGIYVGYRWYDKKKIAPAFPFGFGLSYTTFAFKNAQVQPVGARADDRFTVSVDVTNTGSREGAEVVQLYVRPPASSVDRPVQELKAFARVDLQPGETKHVTLPLDKHSFATYSEASSSWQVPAGDYTLAIGSSSRNIALTAHAKVMASGLQNFQK